MSDPDRVIAGSPLWATAGSPAAVFCGGRSAPDGAAPLSPLPSLNRPPRKSTTLATTDDEVFLGLSDEPLPPEDKSAPLSSAEGSAATSWGRSVADLGSTGAGSGAGATAATGSGVGATTGASADVDGATGVGPGAGAGAGEVAIGIVDTYVVAARILIAPMGDVVGQFTVRFGKDSGNIVK